MPPHSTDKAEVVGRLGSVRGGAADAVVGDAHATGLEGTGTGERSAGDLGHRTDRRRGRATVRKEAFAGGERPFDQRLAVRIRGRLTQPASDDTC